MTNTMTPSEIADALASRRMYGPDSGKLDAQAAATIRAQAEALKIATEALAAIKERAALNGRVNLCASSECIEQDAAQALARIKEVG